MTNKIKQKEAEQGSTECKVLVLHVAKLDSIPGITHGPPKAPLIAIPEHRLNKLTP